MIPKEVKFVELLRRKPELRQLALDTASAAQLQALWTQGVTIAISCGLDHSTLGYLHRDAVNQLLVGVTLRLTAQTVADI